MGVLIETSVWEPSPSLPLFLFVSSFLSITLFSHLTKSAAAATKSSSSSTSPFDHPPSRSFHLRFLLLFSLASVTEGIWSVYGEFEFASSPLSKDLTLTSLCVCYGSAVLFGTVLGMLSDLIGHKRVCLLFWILHLFVAIWKRITFGQSVWLASMCLSLATSIFSFSYETWVVVENEKQAHRPDALSDMFWLMSFFEAAASIGSQMLVNWLMVGSSVDKKVSWVSSSSTAAIVFSIVGIVLISKGWKETAQTTATRDYKLSYMSLLSDKRIGLLGFAHACLQFSIGVFWILWAPTLVADGREVHLGLIYPCLLGSRMLGSTVFPWVLSGSPSLRVEDCLVYIFVALGLSLSIVAYDYQEIGFLVFLFCLFHAGVGLILPSLARLRTMHVPNELRGGMMGLSIAPANAAILFLLLQRGYYESIENSTMMALAALGLFIAAGCMHLLKRQGKQPYQNWHKL